MKPAPFIYHRPGDLHEALDLLSQHGDDALIIAGGQSLVPLLRFRLAQPGHVISLRQISALSELKADAGGLRVGATVTYSKVQGSAAAAKICPGVPMAIELIATPQVRSRGTLCGNLCQADPAAELPAMALVMDANFHLQSTRGSRVVEAVDYFQGPYQTARAADEILTHVHFPARPKGEMVSIQEVTRLRGGFPMSGVAVAFARGPADALSSVRVASFGVSSVQARCSQAEQLLETHGYSAAALSAAAEALLASIHPHADSFASEDYRKSATKTLFMRSMAQAYTGNTAQS